MPSHGSGVVYRRTLIMIRFVGIRTGLEESKRHIARPPLTSDVQWGTAMVVGSVYVGSPMDERRYELGTLLAVAGIV